MRTRTELPGPLSAAPFTIADCQVLGSAENQASTVRHQSYQPGSLSARGMELRAGDGGSRAVRRVARGLDLARHGRQASMSALASVALGLRGAAPEQAAGAAGGPAQGHRRAHGSGVGRRGRNCGRHPDQHASPDMARPRPAVEPVRIGLHGRRARSDSPVRFGGTERALRDHRWAAFDAEPPPESAGNRPRPGGPGLDASGIRFRPRKHCYAWRCATPGSRSRSCSSRCARAAPGSPTADLGYRRRRLAVQYDGGHHLLPAQIFSDRRRDKAFETAGWTVLVLTKDDLADGFAGATAKIKRILRTAYLSPSTASGFSSPI